MLLKRFGDDGSHYQSHLFVVFYSLLFYSNSNHCPFLLSPLQLVIYLWIYIVACRAMYLYSATGAASLTVAAGRTAVSVRVWIRSTR